MMNTELDKYKAVTVADIKNAKPKYFKEENSNTLYYYARNW